MDWRERITLDPHVLEGKPVIKATRICVELVIELLGNDWAEEEILESYPHLTREHIKACLENASYVLHAEKV
jgi:uncharacterized protein (DUF433 family)